MFNKLLRYFRLNTDAIMRTCYFLFLLIEVLEDISSVKKIIKQIISHSSKVLRFPNPEDKKLEVRLFFILAVVENLIDMYTVHGSAKITSFWFLLNSCRKSLLRL